MVSPVVVISSSPLPCTTIAREIPSRLENFCHCDREARMVDPEYLGPCPGRIGERTEDVEDGPAPELLPCRHYMAHGGVVAGCKEECNSHLLDNSCLGFRTDREGLPQVLRGHLLNRTCCSRYGCRV